VDFDLSAAGLRADGADLKISVEVLASKLEQALPGRCRVDRGGGGLFGRGERRVRALEVELGGCGYALAVRGGGLETTRRREVGGIAIKNETLAPAEWISALTEDLRAEAARSSEARTALEELLR
jgi:hypothetical protein